MRQLCLSSSAGCFVQPAFVPPGENEQKVKISGGASLELGQVVHGSYLLSYSNYKEIVKGWQERFLYRLIYDMTLTERIRTVMDIEGQISFAYPQLLNPIETQGTRFLFFPERIEGMYTLGDQEKPFLQFGVGYFPYKFNPDARNLGELEFRSGTYPLWVIANFDHCYGKLLGFRVSSNLFGSLKQDLMLTSEALMFPTQDYSLSYVVHYSPLRVLDIGAGLCLAHLFSTEGKLTTSIDPANSYITAAGDTEYYSFKGIKPSAVVAFDPKLLIGDLFDANDLINSLFGKNDARLYGEICVSGWENRKNYDSAVCFDTSLQMQQYYANRSDRTVIMFGFNVPAFKLLDVLSLEFEHFPNRYPNSFRYILDKNLATPFNSLDQKQFAWRWSCYAKRTFLGKFFIVGQVARDHMRTTFTDLKLSEKEDVLKYGKDWWWVCSFGFRI